MDRLIRIGKIEPKPSVEIRSSRIGIGFEKLDRYAFAPEKALPFVAQTGVKWARIQSGWMRTEKEKGIYEFGWLDEIVDGLIAIGVEPWMCLCYGNPLYSPWAAEYFGAVGCAPVETEEERQGWYRYVVAVTRHFAGRVHYYEVWNEPDGDWCWKRGPDPEELAAFTAATAKACREGDPSCEVLGFATCLGNKMNFLENLCQAGICEHIDGISYHSYKVTDKESCRFYETYDAIRKRYKPSLKLIQGESGTQSRPDGKGALHDAAWTPEKQAKFLLRHLVTDLGLGCDLASYFSCMDMAEALNGKTGEVQTYLDFGYFGVLGADFDEQGRATGAYTPKKSFYALQNLCSVLCNDVEKYSPRYETLIEHSPRLYGPDYDFDKTLCFGFRRSNGAWALCYWHTESNILTQTYEGTATIQIPRRCAGKIRLLDLLNGDIYQLPEEMVQEAGAFVKLCHFPVKDHPMMLTFGDFYQ